jgi:hypothetical protein
MDTLALWVPAWFTMLNSSSRTAWKIIKRRSSGRGSGGSEVVKAIASLDQRAAATAKLEAYLLKTAETSTTVNGLQSFPESA